MEDGQDQQDEKEQAPIGYVADLVSEERLFRKAGVSFGERETFRIFAALKKFVQMKSAAYARFWGKIFGTSKDYYIIETKVDLQGDQPEILESHEPREQGVNKKIFFVTTDRSSK